MTTSNLGELPALGTDSADLFRFGTDGSIRSSMHLHTLIFWRSIVGAWSPCATLLDAVSSVLLVGLPSFCFRGGLTLLLSPWVLFDLFGFSATIHSCLGTVHNSDDWSLVQKSGLLCLFWFSLYYVSKTQQELYAVASGYGAIRLLDKDTRCNSWCRLWPMEEGRCAVSCSPMTVYRSYTHGLLLQLQDLLWHMDESLRLVLKQCPTPLWCHS